MSHNDRTGRTTRMIAEAKRLASLNRAVYVVVSEAQQKQLQQEFDDAGFPRIKVETLSTLGQYDLKTMRVRGAWPNCEFLFDHFVLEFHFQKMLAELHRFDLPAHPLRHEDLDYQIRSKEKGAAWASVPKNALDSALDKPGVWDVRILRTVPSEDLLQLREWSNVIQDQNLPIGNRLQMIASRIFHILPRKYPIAPDHTIRTPTEWACKACGSTGAFLTKEPGIIGNHEVECCACGSLNTGDIDEVMKDLVTEVADLKKQIETLKAAEAQQ